MPTGDPPVEGAWSAGQGPVARRLAVPLRGFLGTEAAADGLVLLAATTVGLLVANSAWSSGYAALWQTELAVEVGRWILALICGIGIEALPEESAAARCERSRCWRDRLHRIAVHRQPGRPGPRARGTRPGRHPGRVGCSPPHLGAVLLLHNALPASARPESIPEEDDA